MNELAQKPASIGFDSTQQIVSAISHDLQGPTRLICSFLQLLEAELGSDLGEQAKEYLDYVTAAAKSLEERLGAITRLSRVSSIGQDPQPCRVREVIDTALTTLEVAINESGTLVTIGETDAVVIADKAQLTDVFVQLVGNSLKFCTAPAQIGIQIESDEGRCLMTVIDSGPGFDARDPDEAFHLFRRFHTASVPGTGTGLTIVRRILERHKATVSIESSAAAHTTVAFALRQGNLAETSAL